MNGPVILCGYGKVGRRIVDCLLADGVEVVVVTLDRPSDVPAGVRFVSGDCRQKSTLIAAGVTSARGVIVCTSDDLANIASALAVRSLAPNVRIVVRAFNPRLVPRLGRAAHNIVALSVSGLAAPLLALLARTGEALGTFPAPDGLREIVERTADKGRPLAELAGDDPPLAWLPATGKPRFLAELTGCESVEAGDRVVVCARSEVVHAGDEKVRWSWWPRRQWRALVRTSREIETLVKVSLAVLLMVLFGSTLIYHFVNGEPLATAFHHTVSVISTSADLRAERYGSFLKWFESGLRLAGAALVAAFTAALTNYLVRARLGGALETARIPDQGHVVVCGLGNVGFRVIEELLRAKQPVVVLEASRDNRFLAAARRLGAAVIIGDCTLPEALRQVKVDAARAVVVTTSNDLANIETALLVRELAPEQRVIVRLADSDLAETLRDAANVRHAVAIPALAAPAFAAALFGDRLRAVFSVAGRLLAAVEIHVESGEVGIEGERVDDLAQRFGIRPIALSRPVGDLPAHRLTVGDCLTAIVALADLDRLYRRDVTAGAADC